MADIREDVMVDEEIALTDIDSGMIISYDELGSKPSINGVEVEGAKTSADYGLAAAGASYTKAEEDALLGTKADKADTYTKAETDAKLSIKADSGDSYTKAEEDTLLGKKADATSVYTKAQTDSAISAAKPDLSGYYTKTETDSAISASQPDLTPYAKTADVDSKLGTKADTSALSAYAKASDVAKKQDALIWDAEPIADSLNPVTSGGIKAYVDTAIAAIVDGNEVAY